MDDTNKASLKNAQPSTIYALKTITEEEAIYTPSTIVYIEVIKAVAYNNFTDYSVSIQGQGMSTTNLLPSGAKLVLEQDKGSSTYTLYGSASGGTVFLRDEYHSTDKCGFALASLTAAENWSVKPMNKTDQYLGIKPDITLNGKYYSTIYTSFPYKIATNMKAYYVRSYWVGSDISNQMAEMVEIENGIVPASTPVILECSSADAANNKVEPLKASEVSTSITGNLLQGVFFSFIKWGFNNNENETPNLGQQLKNVTSYDSENMRMLGTTQDGNLGFVKASDSQLLVSNQGKYIPASKVYLSVPSSSNDDIKLVDTATYAAGIDDIVSDTKITQKGIYTLYGVQISNSSDTEGLPSGIYIINGKKAIVK